MRRIGTGAATTAALSAKRPGPQLDGEAVRPARALIPRNTLAANRPIIGAAVDGMTAARPFEGVLDRPPRRSQCADSAAPAGSTRAGSIPRSTPTGDSNGHA